MAGWSCGLAFGGELRECHDPANPRGWTCLSDVDCLGGWRCGTEGVCVDPSADSLGQLVLAQLDGGAHLNTLSSRAPITLLSVSELYTEGRGRNRGNLAFVQDGHLRALSLDLSSGAMTSESRSRPARSSLRGMPHIALVAPHFLENTNRYVKAFVELEGLKLSLISEDPEKSLPKALRERIAGHYQIESVGAASELARAIKAIKKGVGPVDRLTGALEQLQLPMAEARELTDVPGMRPHIARRFRDKDVMKEVLRKQGVPVAASALVTSPKELEAFAGRVGLPIIVKPQAGVGSRGTHRVESKDDLKAVLERMPPSEKSPLQAEQFIRAREFTCETVSVHGKTVWRSGTRYFPTPLEVLETPWMQYCVMLPREVEAPWTDFAPINEAALQALFGDDPKVVGTAITHMEWFLREDGQMFVSEVGARPPGVQIMPLMSIANEVDMIAKWAELIAFDRFVPPPTRKWAGGAAMFRGQGTGKRIVEVKGLKKALELVGDALVDLRAPKVGMARASGYEGEGFALVRHPKTEGVKNALLALIENVQVRYG